MNVYEFILAMNFWQWCGLMVLSFWCCMTVGYFSRWKPYYRVTSINKPTNYDGMNMRANADGDSDEQD